MDMLRCWLYARDIIREMELTDTYQTQHPFSYRAAAKDKKRRSNAQAENTVKPRGALIAFSVSFSAMAGIVTLESHKSGFRGNKQPGG